MVLFIDPNTEPQLVYKFFQDIDADSNNSINYFEIKQIFDKIDLEKDSPFYVDEQNIKDKQDSRIEDPYQTVLQKIQNIKQMNDKNQINVENAIKNFSNYQPYINLYNLIEMIKSFGININNAEIHEIEKIFGYGQIDINTVMVQFLGLRNPLFDPNEKHDSQKQKISDIPVNPLEQEITDKLKIQDNEMDIEKEKEEQNFLNQSKIKIKQDIQKIQQNQFQNNPNQFQFNFDSYYQIDQMIPGIENFLNIFNFSIANSHHFVDDSFPPCPNSICNDQNDLKFYKTRDKYYWKEPKNIFKGQIYIFQKKQTSLVQSRVGIGEYISPRDIKQGNLGDCYFLSCLSSMAEKPERILKLFITKIYNKFGVYCVKLCHNGKLKAITVDDKFPCHNKYSGPAFSKANGNELWVLLLEKAYAKMYGSYSRIEGGYSQEAYFDLTGAPAYSVHTQNFKTGKHNEKIYDELVYALNFNQFLVNAATSHDITSQISKQIGLIGGHAYSILNVFMVEHPKLGQTFLVKLRNPWGKNDGIFYMKLFDFQSYFSSIQICCYHDDYIRKDIELLSHRKKGTYLFFDIKKEGLYYVTLTQQSKRNLPKKSNYKYSNTQLLLAKMLPDHTFRFYEASQKTEQNNTISSHLTEGRYYIYAKTEWKHKEQDNMVVGVYGPEEVQIMQIEKAFIQDMVEESIKNWASQQGKLSPIKGYPYINGAKHFDMKKGFGYLYMVNKSNHIFKDTITMSQLSGLKARKPFRNNVFKTCLMPNQEVIIVFKVDPLGYSYQLKEQYQIQN
ncbi:hypothetical protein PPERSA_12932 [Pseudocohnilembus persalinus]|uniref:Calpain catalytic domain-containing protein n=1 Tax=Pseudocohnilembus persalinus TaxID=266149 RepID=A0A0V0R1Q6_PSEPJ|nr:hypothetical protein PPERSA_12932 [Pseudocohnilembus persalinus]|eukprot:KRX08451.1 hypothetical protein PPERSA_12932 [Pseudocohnilembus persalinus]